jgi:predicted Zn-dependent protease
MTVFPRRLLESGRHAVLAPAAAVLTRDDAQAIIQRALRLSKADACRVSVQAARETNVRFADNQMSTAGVSSTTAIRIQSVFGRRKASVVTNSRTDDGLRRAVEQSEALARLAPEDPEYLGELGPPGSTPPRS